jgi:D-alanyl-D-alanine carboxypeptidase
VTRRPANGPSSIANAPRPAALRVSRRAFLAGSLAGSGFALLGGRPGRAQEVASLQINSAQYIVIDAETGEVFAQREANERAAMASLTKVFTAIEAIESGPLDLEIETIADDVFNPDTSSVMGIAPGQVFTLRDLLFGLMLPSGNDAAYVIARALGGQPGDDSDAAVQRFVDRINQRVKNMGLNDTVLKNPHGWGVPGHYTTPHDLAAFMMYALKYPFFVELISTREYDIPGFATLYNNNRLLNTYEDLVGGKTGIDNDSGYCLIEVAERGGTTMVSVTLDGIPPEDWYDDNRVLLDYAFETKAERLESGEPISGVVLSYRDPDAAVIQANATNGGTVGQPAVDVDRLAGGSAPQDESGASDSDPAAPSDETSSVAGGTLVQPDSSSPGLSGGVAIAGAVGLVLVARAIGTYARSSGRESEQPAFAEPQDEPPPLPEPIAERATAAAV